jgi:hypothetical protein
MIERFSGICPILPATIDTHCLEFDAVPTAERIIERLGDDILVEVRTLSNYAQEVLWIPYRNSDGAATSWTRGFSLHRPAVRSS